MEIFSQVCEEVGGSPGELRRRRLLRAGDQRIQDY
jgi:hypothetical protein